MTKTFLTRKAKPALLMIGPAVLFQLLIVFYPLILCLIASFQNYNLLSPGSAKYIGFRNYITMATDASVLHSLAVSGKFVAASVTISTLLGLLSGLLLSSNLRMIGLFRSLFIIPMMITPAVTALIWVQLWHTRYGAINAILGGLGISGINWLGDPGTALFAIIISDVWQWTPFVCLIVIAGFQSLPTEVFEASVVDGVNGLQQFFMITLPLLMPFLGTAILFRIVYSLRVYELAWIQTWGGPGNSTELMSVRVAIKAFTDLKIGQSSALSILLLIAVTILTTVLYRLVFSPKRTR